MPRNRIAQHLSAVCTFLLLAALTAPTHGQMLGATWDGKLVGIDPVSGVTGEIATTPGHAYNAMGRSADGTVYVLNTTFQSQILRFDPSTNQLVNYSFSGEEIRGFAGHPTQAGIFYALTLFNFGPTELYRYDLSTPMGGATPTFIGSFSLGAQNLAFDDQGRLFHFANGPGLVEVDTNTASWTNVNGLADGFPDVQALVFVGGAFLAIATDTIYSVDRGTGVATLLHSTALPDIRGAEIQSDLKFSYTHCPTTANSAGAGATLSTVGDLSLAANNLSVQLQGAPPSQFGVLLVSLDPVQAPLGAGTLCLGPQGGGLLRVLPAQLSDGTGSITFPVDFASRPFPSTPSLLEPGRILLTQAWYRDAGASPGNNLSEAMGLMLAP